jgi:hypothetical protein
MCKRGLNTDREWLNTGVLAKGSLRVNRLPFGRKRHE